MNAHFPARPNTRLPFLSLLTCLLLMQAGSAFASLYRVDSLYTNGANSVLANAFFDLSTITGTGDEEAQVTDLILKFNFRSYKQSVNINVVAGPSWPEGTILAHFNDGNFLFFDSVDRGGNNSVAVTPPSNWLGENVSLGPALLLDIPCCAGFVKYELQSSSDPILVGPLPAVPVPAAIWLFGSALIGLVGFGKRKSWIVA